MAFTDPALWPALVTLATLVAMFAVFCTDRYPPEVVALSGASFLLATGVLRVDDFLGVFSNPAPITIAAMFVLSGALVRAGVLDLVTQRLARQAEARPRRVLGGFAGVTLGASAFMNNTPVVVMMIPVAVRLAGSLRLHASQLLIPLSYVAVLGGTCTLIGTSTNLLVDGIAQRHGLDPFGLFEVTALAIPIALAGLAFIAVAAPRLLPRRDSLVDFLSAKRQPKFFTEVAIPEGSRLIGKPVLSVDKFTREGMTVIDVLRGDASLRRTMRDVILEAGDRVVIRTGMNDLLELRESRGLALPGEAETVGQKSTVTVEALIMPGARLAGRVLGDLRLRRRYGVYPLALHRREGRVGTVLDEVRLRVGDTLLLEGAPDDIARLAQDQGLADLTRPSERPYRRQRAPIAIGVLAAVVLGGALGLMPIAGLAVIGVAVVLLTGSIDAEEAFEMIEGRLLVLIFSMLGIGVALESTGAVGLLVERLAPLLMALPAALVLWVLFLMASALTELVSNNAVAVVMTPVAISLAEALGADARPFVVTVMIAASASFATPIGYQTNTLVYAPGGYRFTDFMRLGVAMNLGAGVITALLVPVIWPL
jgi:di/tricarboxylate transporter